MWKLNKKASEFVAFADGKLIPIEQMTDPVFAEKMMGDGYGIEPTGNIIVSPCNGKIMMVFETLHSIGIMTDDGIEVILHIGIDTIKLKGNGFKCFVTVGDSVKSGDKLLEVDLKLIEKEGYSTQSCAIFPNAKVTLLKSNKFCMANDDKIIKVKKIGI